MQSEGSTEIRLTLKNNGTEHEYMIYTQTLVAICRAVASSIIGAGADIHIFVFCTINFF